MRITGKTIDETDKRILEMISRGKTYKQIAGTLYTKLHNVQYRLRVLKREYQCPTVPSLIAYAYESGLMGSE